MVQAWARATVTHSDAGSAEDSAPRTDQALDQAMEAETAASTALAMAVASAASLARHSGATKVAALGPASALESVTSSAPAMA